VKCKITKTVNKNLNLIAGLTAIAHESLRVSMHKKFCRFTHRNRCIFLYSVQNMYCVSKIINVAKCEIYHKCNAVEKRSTWKHAHK
jgi:hypothetical protein